MKGTRVRCSRSVRQEVGDEGLKGLLTGVSKGLSQYRQDREYFVLFDFRGWNNSVIDNCHIC